MDGSNENRTRIRLLARSPKASEALTLDDLVVLTTYDLGETRRTMSSRRCPSCDTPLRASSSGGSVL